jgi:hypothetical protein
MKMIVVAALALLALSACESSTKTDVVLAPPADAAKTPEPAVGEQKAALNEGTAKEAAPADAKADTYTIVAPALELGVGSPGMLTLEVKPAPGHKINEEFPWKATLSAPPGVMLTSAELPSEQWTISKESATTKSPLTASQAVDGEIKAKLNFSVCDDSACQIIRDKEVTIKVAAK